MYEYAISQGPGTLLDYGVVHTKGEMAEVADTVFEARDKRAMIFERCGKRCTTGG